MTESQYHNLHFSNKKPKTQSSSMTQPKSHKDLPSKSPSLSVSQTPLGLEWSVHLPALLPPAQAPFPRLTPVYSSDLNLNILLLFMCSPTAVCLFSKNQILEEYIYFVVIWFTTVSPTEYNPIRTRTRSVLPSPRIPNAQHSTWFLTGCLSVCWVGSAPCGVHNLAQQNSVFKRYCSTNQKGMHCFLINDFKSKSQGHSLNHTHWLPATLSPLPPKGPLSEENITFLPNASTWHLHTQDNMLISNRKS